MRGRPRRPPASAGPTPAVLPLLISRYTRRGPFLPYSGPTPRARITGIPLHIPGKPTLAGGPRVGSGTIWRPVLTALAVSAASRGSSGLVEAEPRVWRGRTPGSPHGGASPPPASRRAGPRGRRRPARDRREPQELLGYRQILFRSSPGPLLLSAGLVEFLAETYSVERMQAEEDAPGGGIIERLAEARRLLAVNPELAVSLISAAQPAARVPGSLGSRRLRLQAPSR